MIVSSSCSSHFANAKVDAMRFRNQTKIWYHPISISTNQLWTNWCSWWGQCVKCHFFQTEMLGCWHYHGTKPLRCGDVLINFPLIRIMELLQDPNWKNNSCCQYFLVVVFGRSRCCHAAASSLLSPRQCHGWEVSAPSPYRPWTVDLKKEDLESQQWKGMDFLGYLPTRNWNLAKKWWGIWISFI